MENFFSNVFLHGKPPLIFLACILFIIFINTSCYFSYTNYENNELQIGDIIHLKKNDTLIITNFINYDTSLSKFAAVCLKKNILKHLSLYIPEPNLIDSILIQNRIYSLPFEFQKDLMNHLYLTLKTRYIITGYFTKLEESDVHKDAEVEIVLNIYDLFQKDKILKIRSNLQISAPNPPEGSWYVASIHSKRNSIEELIELIVEREMKNLFIKNLIGLYKSRK